MTNYNSGDINDKYKSVIDTKVHVGPTGGKGSIGVNE